MTIVLGLLTPEGAMMASDTLCATSGGILRGHTKKVEVTNGVLWGFAGEFALRAMFRETLQRAGRGKLSVLEVLAAFRTELDTHRRGWENEESITFALALTDGHLFYEMQDTYAPAESAVGEISAIGSGWVAGTAAFEACQLLGASDESAIRTAISAVSKIMPANCGGEVDFHWLPKRRQRLGL